MLIERVLQKVFCLYIFSQNLLKKRVNVKFGRDPLSNILTEKLLFIEGPKALSKRVRNLRKNDFDKIRSV